MGIFADTNTITAKGKKYHCFIGIDLMVRNRIGFTIKLLSSNGHVKLNAVFTVFSSGNTNCSMIEIQAERKERLNLSLTHSKTFASR